MITLFSSGFLEKSMQNYNVEDWEKKKAIVKDWRESIIEYDKEKETAIKSAFFMLVFKDLLGYKQFGSKGNEYHFKEEWNVKKIGRADFVLGEIHNSQIEVMGELKSLYDDLDKPQLGRKDLRSPVQQGFEYLYNMPDEAKFLIVSNQNEIRIYKRGIHNKYNSFFFVLPESEKDRGKKDLTDELELKKFIYLLSREHLLSCGNEKSITEKLLETQIEDERHLEKKFYAEYKQLRENIFFSLLEKNPEYKDSKADLLSLTQKFLDRIIFCWFCEDSREQLLPPDVLARLINKELKDDFYDKNGTSIYSKVKGLFDAINVGNPVFKIDKGYNGGLFKTDEKLDKLKITNEMFETIGELSRYDFGNDEILNVNVLGHIFEQSISDLEELKSEFEGEVYDKKKSKRKKEGVYYTPEYITKYIVENTIGKWLDERFAEYQEKHKRKRKEKELLIYRDYQHSLHEIKVLDPACGSGAFLVEAFDYLLNENRRVVDVINQLTDDDSQVKIFDNYKYVNSILQNNLYGVDLNSESVEITKLSLWLKTAERNKKLTELDKNIRCGNSLIDDESIAGDKAFKWNDEFKDIMDKGGFDCVIGNPPYGAFFNENQKSYLKTKFSAYDSENESYIFFIENAYLLIKNKGYLGYITPSNLFTNVRYFNIRTFLLKNTILKYLVDLGSNVFYDANVDSCITIFCKALSNNYIIKTHYYKEDGIEKSISNIPYRKKYKKDFLEAPDNIFNIYIYEKHLNIIKRIDKLKYTNLNHIFNIYRGIEYGYKSKYIKNKKITDKYKPIIAGRCFNRYSLYFENKYIEFNDSDPSNFKNKSIYETEKLFVRRIGNSIIATYDNNNLYNVCDVYNLILKDNNIDIKYALSILNSMFITFYYFTKFRNAKLLFPKIPIKTLYKLPIPDISPEAQKPFIEKAEIMLSLNESLNEKKQTFFEWLENAFDVDKFSKKLTKMETLTKDQFTKELGKAKVNVKDMEIFNQCIKVYKDIKAIKDDIDRTDAEIDEMVFDLYGLTNEERQIVRESV